MSLRSGVRPPIFEFQHSDAGQVVKITCSRCPKSDTIKSVKNLGLGLLVRRFRNAGWAVHDAYTQRKVLCPDCRAGALHGGGSRASISMADRMVPGPLVQLPPFAAFIRKPSNDGMLGTRNDGKLDKRTIKKSDAIKPKGDDMTKTPADRALDTAQREKVRDLLDAHFDAKAGRYSAGYSDQRIGKEVNVPWSLVAQLRDFAYGPIKADPEMDYLRTELVKVGTQIAELQLRIERSVDEASKIETELHAARDRVKELEHRIGLRDAARAS